MEYSTHDHMVVSILFANWHYNIPIFYAFYVEYSTHYSEKVVLSASLQIWSYMWSSNNYTNLPLHLILPISLVAWLRPQRLDQGGQLCLLERHTFYLFPEDHHHKFSMKFITSINEFNTGIGKKSHLIPSYLGGLGYIQHQCPQKGPDAEHIEFVSQISIVFRRKTGKLLFLISHWGWCKYYTIYFEVNLEYRRNKGIR